MNGMNNSCTRSMNVENLPVKGCHSQLFSYLTLVVLNHCPSAVSVGDMVLCLVLIQVRGCK